MILLYLWDIFVILLAQRVNYVSGYLFYYDVLFLNLNGSFVYFTFQYVPE
jgi:hypothetical protein